jgi:hypothetical protein
MQDASLKAEELSFDSVGFKQSTSELLNERGR